MSISQTLNEGLQHAAKSARILALEQAFCDHGVDGREALEEVVVAGNVAWRETEDATERTVLELALARTIDEGWWLLSAFEYEFMREESSA